jgi:hypothetical protein
VGRSRTSSTAICRPRITTTASCTYASTSNPTGSWYGWSVIVKGANPLDREHADVPPAVAVADHVEPAHRVPKMIGVDLPTTGLAAGRREVPRLDGPPVGDRAAGAIDDLPVRAVGLVGAEPDREELPHLADEVEARWGERR